MIFFRWVARWWTRDRVSGSSWVSVAWVSERQRREFSEGIDQPCIDWRAMRDRDL